MIRFEHLTMAKFERYAVYFAPKSDSLLGQFGNHWLGLNPETGRSLLRPVLPEISSDVIAKYTPSPSRYGFHGTLKPPFRLHGDYTIGDLDSALEELRDELSPVETGPLVLKEMSGFLALSPTGDQTSLVRLAEKCVRMLDRFRGAQTPDELAKRRNGNLSARQESYLDTWGYPYVMEEFRFHLTLSNNVEPDVCRLLKSALTTPTQALCTKPFIVDQICLFGDPGSGAPFRLLKRYTLS